MAPDATTYATPDDFEYLALLEFERAEARRVARRARFIGRLARESTRARAVASSLERPRTATR